MVPIEAAAHAQYGRASTPCYPWLSITIHRQAGQQVPDILSRPVFLSLRQGLIQQCLLRHQQALLPFSWRREAQRLHLLSGSRSQIQMVAGKPRQTHLARLRRLLQTHFSAGDVAIRHGEIHVSRQATDLIAHGAGRRLCHRFLRHGGRWRGIRRAGHFCGRQRAREVVPHHPLPHAQSDGVVEYSSCRAAFAGHCVRPFVPRSGLNWFIVKGSSNPSNTPTGINNDYVVAPPGKPNYRQAIE